MGAPLWETTVAQLRTPRARSNTSYRTSLGDDSCAVASTQSQIKHLLPHLSGRQQLRSCEHPEPDQTPPTAPLWETTAAQLRAPRARSNTSYRTSLEHDSCAVASTQNQIKHLLQRLSGRRQLRSCGHPEPDQTPPTAPLWETKVRSCEHPEPDQTPPTAPLCETTVAQFRAPRAR